MSHSKHHFLIGEMSKRRRRLNVTFLVGQRKRAHYSVSIRVKKKKRPLLFLAVRATHLTLLIFQLLISHRFFVVFFAKKVEEESLHSTEGGGGRSRVIAAHTAKEVQGERERERKREKGLFLPLLSFS